VSGMSRLVFGGLKFSCREEMLDTTAGLYYSQQRIYPVLTNVRIGTDYLRLFCTSAASVQLFL
jgi:hypothetical protein